jgi:hypothetical protein
MIEYLRYGYGGLSIKKPLIYPLRQVAGYLAQAKEILSQQEAGN